MQFFGGNIDVYFRKLYATFGVEQNQSRADVIAAKIKYTHNLHGSDGFCGKCEEKKIRCEKSPIDVGQANYCGYSNEGGNFAASWSGVSQWAPLALPSDGSIWLVAGAKRVRRHKIVKAISQRTTFHIYFHKNMHDKFKAKQNKIVCRSQMEWHNVGCDVCQCLFGRTIPNDHKFIEFIMRMRMLPALIGAVSAYVCLLRVFSTCSRVRSTARIQK